MFKGYEKYNAVLYEYYNDTNALSVLADNVKVESNTSRQVILDNALDEWGLIRTNTSSEVLFYFTRTDSKNFPSFNDKCIRNGSLKFLLEYTYKNETTSEEFSDFIRITAYSAHLEAPHILCLRGVFS